MVRCKRCNSIMVESLLFSQEKREKFYKCPKCDNETEHIRIENKEVVFKDLFQEELQK